MNTVPHRRSRHDTTGSVESVDKAGAQPVTLGEQGVIVRDPEQLQRGGHGGRRQRIAAVGAGPHAGPLGDA